MYYAMKKYIFIALVCIAACAGRWTDEWESGGCKFSLLQKLFFQCCIHNIFLGGIFTKEASGPRMTSFCAVVGIMEEANRWCRGGQMLSTLWRGELMVNRICKHLRWRLWIETAESSRRWEMEAKWLWTHTSHMLVYMLPMKPKKRCSLCAKKKRTIQFNQVKETEDTCCQAAQRNCLSSSEDSGSVSTCVESTHALILHYMWLHTEKKKLQ